MLDFTTPSNADANEPSGHGTSELLSHIQSIGATIEA